MSDIVGIVFCGHKVEGALGWDIIVFEEMRLAHDQISIVDPFHAFDITEFHGVFLHADGGLFEGTVHGGVHCHAILLGTVVIDAQHLRIVVLHLGLELALAVF